MKHAYCASMWVLAACIGPAAHADWEEDVGYTSLVNRLGAGVPNGAGIAVKQIEEPAGGTNPAFIYHPDETSPEFAGKTFTNKCTTCDNTNASGHATDVGYYYYGNTNMASGVSTIDVDEAGNWVVNSLNATLASAPLTESRRILNHSWVGSFGSDAIDNDVDRRFDLVLQRDGVVAAIAVNNGGATPIPQVPSSSYNAISVGLTSGGSSFGPVVAGMDGEGRVKPDMVAPDQSGCCTSFATPRVASAVALLLQTEDALSILSSLTTTQGKIGKAVLAKALLMAGATKDVFASSGGWRKGFAIPTNDGSVPLDYRFGAGQLNIDNSDRILTFNPQQSPSGSVLVTSTGWNYETINAALTDQYFFQVPNGAYIASLSGLVTWNRHVSQTGSTLTPSVANLDLKLYNATGFTKGTLIDQSVSTIDNVEHIWKVNLTAGRYLLEVTATSIPSPATSWEYALAWDAITTPATLPPDLDHDGDVDGDDLTLFKACALGAGVPRSAECAAADFDSDNDVDSDDFGKWQRCYSGKGVIAPATCWNP